MRDKFKYLFKNTWFLFIGNFSSKILVFLLVPLYTSVLSTSEYGIYDLTYTTIQLLMPILSLNIIDGVMRFTIDADDINRKYTFFTSIKCILFSVTLFVTGIIFLGLIFDNQIIENYPIEIILFFISYTFSQFTVQFARGLDDIKGVSIAGMIGTIIVIASNILFLLVLRLGLRGYFWAYICSYGLQGLFLFIHSKTYLFYLPPEKMGEVGRKYGREMLTYCWPLIFNTLSWYINGVADRYTVTFFDGIDVNGIYSVSYKIPAILNAFQTIFIQAWQLSAIKEFESEEREIFYKKTYQSVQAVMILLCSALIIATRFLASLLFSNEFYIAWKFVPILLIYVIFNTLSGSIGSIFSAAKDSKAFSISAIVGATVNIVLNIVLVFAWGAEGAAIATVISSIVIWAMRMHFASKYVKMNLSFKMYFVEYALLFLQAGIMSCIESAFSYYLQIGIIIVLLVLNYIEFKGVLGRGFIFNKKSVER